MKLNQLMTSGGRKIENHFPQEDSQLRYAFVFVEEKKTKIILEYLKKKRNYK